MSTAKTILAQLGGNKFLAMTGAKNLLDTGDGLSMHLPQNGSKAKYLSIKLDRKTDTYTMIFQYEAKKLDKEMTKAAKSMGIKKRFYTSSLKEVANFSGVYFDKLQERFIEVTKMYTSL